MLAVGLVGGPSLPHKCQATVSIFICTVVFVFFFKHFIELKPQVGIMKLCNLARPQSSNVFCHVGAKLVYTQLAWVLNFSGHSVLNIFSTFPKHSAQQHRRWCHPEN